MLKTSKDLNMKIDWKRIKLISIIRCGRSKALHDNRLMISQDEMDIIIEGWKNIY